MPYTPSSRSKQVTASTVELTFYVDPRWVKAGERLRFSGTLKRDGKGWAGQVIEIYRYVPEYGVWSKFYETKTLGAPFEGYYDVSVEMPHYLACRDVRWKAKHPDTGTWSEEKKAAVAYPTRISLKAPDWVKTGEEFEVKGKLEYESAKDVWRPLARRTVKIYLDDTLLATTFTDDKGNYSRKVVVEKAGTYTLKAVFEGAGLPTAYAYAPSAAELAMAAGPTAIPLAAALAPVAAVVAVIVASELSKK